MLVCVSLTVLGNGRVSPVLDLQLVLLDVVPVLLGTCLVRSLERLGLLGGMGSLERLHLHTGGEGWGRGEELFRAGQMMVCSRSNARAFFLRRRRSAP